MPPTKRSIIVQGEPVEVVVSNRRGQSWVVVGTHKGVQHEARGRSEGSALVQWRDWATKQGTEAMQPEDIMVTGDDEAGWFFHHPDLGKDGPLSPLQAALREAVQLGVKHDVGVSFQMVDGTEKRYWAVGEPLPE